MAAAEPTLVSPFDWTVTLGVETRVLPTYEGSATSMLRPFPMFDIHRAGTPASFRSPRDGFSFGILDSGRFQAGPTVKVRFARTESSDNDLRGLGDIPWTLEAAACVRSAPARRRATSGRRNGRRICLSNTSGWPAMPPIRRW